MLALRNVALRRGGQPIVHDVSFSASAGERSTISVRAPCSSSGVNVPDGTGAPTSRRKRRRHSAGSRGPSSRSSRLCSANSSAAGSPRAGSS